ncbi:RNA-directed DNA polymerase, eukaryota, partial [Tanacetum coccineum]
MDDEYAMAVGTSKNSLEDEASSVDNPTTQNENSAFVVGKLGADSEMTPKRKSSCLWHHSNEGYFVSDERVVWVDIEGIPLHVWSRETFAKIGNKWGEALDIEDNFGSSFARKRLCILTKQPESILEKFKVIFKGKVFVARAKELFTWNPSFLEPKESVYTSDDESKHGTKILNDGAQNSDVESDDECNVDG